MKESYVKGLANHNGPESCVGWSNRSDEALTGESAGRVLSHEKGFRSGCRPCRGMGKATTNEPQGQGTLVSRGVGDPEQARKQLAREPRDPATTQAGTLGTHREVYGHTTMMNGRRKSDICVVPTKAANKLMPLVRAEQPEGRRMVKGNVGACSTSRTQCRTRPAGGTNLHTIGVYASRHDLRQEPDALIALVRICGGGGQ